MTARRACFRASSPCGSESWGTAPGRADALSASLGRSTTYTAVDVRPGTYYVRVRGRNACGTGVASNELIVEVE
jgi:hypothetical protein